MLYYFWHRGHARRGDRLQFVNHIRSFTALHFTGMFIYVLLPVAPPWWVSLHQFARPTAELVAQTKMTAAMDGAIVQGVIQSAAVWFAAVPSLHGAYPVLMLLLALKTKNRLVIAALIFYTLAMFASTVLLNQHYIIDLLAGALVAFACYLVFGRKTFETGR
jgi:membrane-associated phospholipid phosphatase